jgi:hypothetical protein
MQDLQSPASRSATTIFFGGRPDPEAPKELPS